MSTEADFRREFFKELSDARGIAGQGGGPLTLLEKLGRRKVPVQFFEPDPLTSHSDYYYNARQNVLYKRKTISSTRAVWSSVATI